jgi:hypothetical protein
MHNCLSCKWDIRCNICGRFISGQDLDDGTAEYTMTLPDSYYSEETWKGICKRCKAKEDNDDA